MHAPEYVRDLAQLVVEVHGAHFEGVQALQTTRRGHQRWLQSRKQRMNGKATEVVNYQERRVVPRTTQLHTRGMHHPGEYTSPQPAFLLTSSWNIWLSCSIMSIWKERASRTVTYRETGMKPAFSRKYVKKICDLQAVIAKMAQ